MQILNFSEKYTGNPKIMIISLFHDGEDFRFVTSEGIQSVEKICIVDKEISTNVKEFDIPSLANCYAFYNSIEEIVLNGQTHSRYKDGTLFVTGFCQYDHSEYQFGVELNTNTTFGNKIFFETPDESFYQNQSLSRITSAVESSVTHKGNRYFVGIDGNYYSREGTQRTLNIIGFHERQRFVAQGKYVFYYGSEAFDRLFNLNNLGQPIFRSGSTECAQFSPNGKILAICNSDKHLILIDTQTYETFTTFQTGLDEEILHCCFSSDGNTVAISTKSKIQIWDIDI